jgi:hypothetical protein
MANQTVTTAVNFDDASVLGLLNGESFTINGGALTINSDNRWSQNSAVMSAITISSTLGGSMTIDGTTVWWMPYTGGTGNVPALGTAGTQNCTGGTSGATGEFLGIWSALGVAPTAAAAAMPATGFIKFRSKVGSFTNGETVTLPGGATITVNSATGGQRGWLDVVGADALITVPRLGSFTASGDWFELGTTDGTDDQFITIPWMSHIPAIWVETGPGTGVYDRWLNAGARWDTATQFISTDTRGAFFGQWYGRSATTTISSNVIALTDTSGLTVNMPVSGSANLPTNGLVITAINPGVSITVSQNASAGGAITLYVCRNTIEIANRATNSCGFKPAGGCKIRVPNILIGQSANTAGNAWQGNILPATNNNRWEFATTQAGVVTLNKVMFNGYLNVSGAYSLDLTSSAFSAGSSINIVNIATPMTVTDCVFGGLEHTIDANATLFSALPYGLTITDCRAIKYAAPSAGGMAFQFLDVAGLTVTRCRGEQFGAVATVLHGSTDQRSFYISRCTDAAFTDCVCIGASIRMDQSSGITITGLKYADCHIGTTQTTNGFFAVQAQSSTTDVQMSGFGNFDGIANVHPYNQIFNSAAGATNLRIREIGTPSSPYGCGSSNAMSTIVSLSTGSDAQLNRLYAVNTRTGAVATSNTFTGVVCDNVWGDDVDSQAITLVQVACRGCLWTNSTTGQNAVYGRHWEDAWTSATTGRILIAANEPVAATAAQAVITAGTPRYTSTGNISMPTVGDQVVWECPYFVLGATSLTNLAPTVTGTLTGNITLEFQWDLGSGYNGSWTALTGANLAAVGAITPATGVRLKVRATAAVADPTNALTYITIQTDTNSTDRQITYPYQYTGTGTMPSFSAGTRVQIYNVTTADEIYNAVPSGTSLTYQYYTGTGISAGNTLRVRMAKAGQLPFEGFAVASSSGFSVLGSQSVDAVYVANGVDGSTVTEFVADYPNVQVDINDPDNTTSMQRLYAWAKYTESTATGIEEFFAAVEAENTLSYIVHNAIADIYLDNIKTAGCRVTGGWLYRDDGAIPVAVTSTGPIYFESGIRLSAANANPFTNTSQGSRSYGQEWRDMVAVLTGKTTGGGSTQEVFYAPDGTTPRVTSNNDGVNRTSVVVSGS